MWVRRVILGVASVGMVIASGCADVDEQSLCTVYADFQSAAADLQQVVVGDGTADEAADSVDAVLGQVRHLRAVADTRYADQLDELERSVDDLLRVVESIDEDADAATWEPLVEDSVENARFRAAAVQDVIDPVCSPAAD
jgi:hypothetical protein